MSLHQATHALTWSGVRLFSLPRVPGSLRFNPSRPRSRYALQISYAVLSEICSVAIISAIPSRRDARGKALTRAAHCARNSVSIPVVPSLIRVAIDLS